jgi:hypothetical protein
LPRVDQKQARAATISRARLGKGADGDAVGLPHLQLAALDPLEEARSRRKLKRAEKQTHRDRPKRFTKTRALTPLLRARWVSSQLQPKGAAPGCWQGFEAEWSQIYPLGALLLVWVGVAIGGGLVSLGWAMSESTPEGGACTSPNFFGGDK